MENYINIPIYYTETSSKTKVLDVEGMEDEFNSKIEELEEEIKIENKAIVEKRKNNKLKN